ncbi:MAG: hypothetical protein ACOYXC_11515 [Candidatus Rifleibacteriota bacterium]
MSRILSLLFSIIVFIAIFAVKIDVTGFFEMGSALLTIFFPVLFLLSVYSPSQIVRAVKNLDVPADAGGSALEYRQSAQIFTAYGIFSLSVGVSTSIISVIYLLMNLADPAGLSRNISVSLLAIFYSFIIMVFFCYPAAKVLENAAHRAEVFSDDS